MYWRYDVCKDKHFYHSDGDEHESLRHDVLREFVRGKAGPNGWQGLEIMLSSSLLTIRSIQIQIFFLYLHMILIERLNTSDYKRFMC